MDAEIIADLKQFIAATVSQQLAGTEERLEKRITDFESNMNTKFDDLSQSIAEVIDTSNDAHDQRLNDHEKRIARLEHKAA